MNNYNIGPTEHDDTSKKIITSYRIFPKRDTICAIKSIYESISKYKVVPENLNIITDGNSIYNAAQIFFQLIILNSTCIK